MIDRFQSLSGTLFPDANLLEFECPSRKYLVHTRGKDVLNFVFYLKSDDYRNLPEILLCNGH